MELLSYEQARDLLNDRAVLRFVVEPQNQRLRKYHDNEIVTLYTKEGTFLVEARVEETEKWRKLLPPKALLRDFVRQGEEYCFHLPGRNVCERNPSCVTDPQRRGRQTKFCKVHNAFCQDRYHQYKYVCDAIHDDEGDVFSEGKIAAMTLTELNEFIRSAGLCHDARYEHLKSCPAFDNKQHRDYLFFLEHRITFAYKEKIAREVPLLSEQNSLMLRLVIPALDRDLILQHLKSAPFWYHVRIMAFTRAELDYLFMLHMREDSV